MVSSLWCFYILQLHFNSSISKTRAINLTTVFWQISHYPATEWLAVTKPDSSFFWAHSDPIFPRFLFGQQCSSDYFLANGRTAKMMCATSRPGQRESPLVISMLFSFHTLVADEHGDLRSHLLNMTEPLERRYLGPWTRESRHHPPRTLNVDSNKNKLLLYLSHFIYFEVCYRRKYNCKKYTMSPGLLPKYLWPHRKIFWFSGSRGFNSCEVDVGGLSLYPCMP